MTTYRLRIADEVEFTAQGTIGSDGDEPSPYSIRLRAKRAKLSELRRATRERTMDDVEYLVDKLIGWPGLVDDAGAPVPFTEERLREFLEVPGLAAALVHELVEASGVKGKLGN